MAQQFATDVLDAPVAIAPAPSMGEVFEMAVHVLGSVESGIEWLSKPAFGLERRRPMDVMQTEDGARAVATYLMQIEHGVYV